MLLFLAKFLRFVCRARAHAPILEALRERFREVFVNGMQPRDVASRHVQHLRCDVADAPRKHLLFLELLAELHRALGLAHLFGVRQVA